MLQSPLFLFRQVPAWSSDSDVEGGTFYLATEPGAAAREGWYDLEVQSSKRGSSNPVQADEDPGMWRSNRGSKVPVPADEPPLQQKAPGGSAKSGAKKSGHGSSIKAAPPKGGGGGRSGSSHNGSSGKSRASGGGSSAGDGGRARGDL